MKLTLADSKIFKDSVSIISDLVSEVKIKFNEDGLSIVAVDPATVALVSFKLPKSAFSKLVSQKGVILYESSHARMA